MIIAGKPEGAECNTVVMKKDTDSKQDDHNDPSISHPLQEQNSFNLVTTHGSGSIHHIFQWDGGGKEVFLVGSFNGWEKVPVTLPNG